MTVQQAMEEATNLIDNLEGEVREYQEELPQDENF